MVGFADGAEAGPLGRDPPDPDRRWTGARPSTPASASAGWPSSARQGRRRLRWIVGRRGGWRSWWRRLWPCSTPRGSAPGWSSVTGAHPHTGDGGHRGRRRPRAPPSPDQRGPRGDGRDGWRRCPFIATAQVHRHWPDGVTDRGDRAGAGGGHGRPGPAWSVLDGYGRTLAVRARPARRPGGADGAHRRGSRDPAGAGGQHPGRRAGPFGLDRVPHPAAGLLRPGGLGDRGRRRHGEPGPQLGDHRPAGHRQRPAPPSTRTWPPSSPTARCTAATTIDVTVPQSPTVTG